GAYRNRFTPKEIVGVASSRPVDFAPGEKFHYSNTGYYLLARALEAASGKSYGDLLRERLVGALGLAPPRGSGPGGPVPPRARGYELREGVLENRDAMQPSACSGAGTLVSTIGDLAKWDAAIDAHRILDAATQESMWTVPKLASGAASTYGFGWFVAD